MDTKDIFHITDEQAGEIDQLKDTFKNKSDLRAALEDYFHIYDDFAEMSEDEFNDAFEEYSGKSEVNSSMNKEVKSSAIGDIKDQFALGKIKEEDAVNRLTKEGKGKREAEKIVEKWKQKGVVTSSLNEKIAALNDMNSDFEVVEYVKDILDENGMSDKYSEFTEETDKTDNPEEIGKIAEKYIRMTVKSSVDSVVKEMEDYFGTEAGEDNVIECDDIITRKDVTEIESLIEDDDDVKVKIGMYSVTVDEAPETIESAVDLSVEEDEDNVTVSIEKPEDEDNVIDGEVEDDSEESDGSTGTSFVQINSEEDFDNYNVHLPEDYEFSDIEGMWWEIDGDEGISMREVIQRSGDKEQFIVIDNDRLFFDTAYNYILDSDLEPEDFGFESKEFEEGEFVGE